MRSMLKRLAIGLLKGLLVGGAVGAGLHFGLGWTRTAGLLGYLIAMGAGGTAGVLAGRPPWQHAAWIESVLKAVVGVGVGALLYWLGSSFAAVELPWALPGAEATAPWTATPLLFAPPIAALYGAIVELDNTGDSSEGGDGDGKDKDEAAPKKRRKSEGASANVDALLGPD